ncbi:hypothetical protein CRYUN_Cryun35bG0094300 [Craigia yunnanensis]
MFKEFPNVGNDLKQLLQMIDDGQAVDIKGISEQSLNKHLKKLFLSLNLKENEPKEQQPTNSGSMKEAPSILEHAECGQVMDEDNSDRDNSTTPKRRETELEEDNELFIGPPPPALVAEAESANEAERFEEVPNFTPYVSYSNLAISLIGFSYRFVALWFFSNLFCSVSLACGHCRGYTEKDLKFLKSVLSISHALLGKKRYWKLSLLVHPDKCPHPQAHQAFVILNKAFKELQDPDKMRICFIYFEYSHG